MDKPAESGTDALDGRDGAAPPGKDPAGSSGEAEGTAQLATEEARKTATSAAEETKHVVGAAAGGAQQVASEAGTQARQVIAEAGSQIRGLASQTRDQLQSQAEDQTRRAGQNLRTLSEQAFALADGRIEDAGPLAGQIRKLASQLAEGADRVERRGFDGIVADIGGFARRRPTAFIGLTALAGFAVSRIGRNLGGPDDAEPWPRRALPAPHPAGGVDERGRRWQQRSLRTPSGAMGPIRPRSSRCQSSCPA
jgi:hypothetical protein